MNVLIDTLTKFNNKQAVIGIIGLGYVGLPLMLRYTSAGFRVIGIDVDAKKVEQLKAGESYIEHIPAETISAALRSGFEATTDFSRVAKCDALVKVCAYAAQ